MKISYNWLKDYLSVDLAAEKMGQILTATGLEVEGIEQQVAVVGGLAGLVVGQVVSCQKHPNADKLSLTQVDVGQEQLLSIVCGAPNVAQNIKVVVATVGTTLYPTEGEPFKIKKSKIRGERSEGMICALDEIGLGTDHSGIIVLDSDIPVGTPAKEVFDLKEDFIFDIGLTPNRSDATNHIGVAKDALASLLVNHNYTGSLHTPDVSEFKVHHHHLPIAIEVQDTEACPRYAGVSITGVSIKPSPDWMQDRLSAIGVRPINNVVDITNFILHELGQPLHAFDADKITGNKIIVKKLAQGTPFTTLDETERKLDADDLMICDGEEKGMCIAGVFGGISSGVTEATTNIFLESACFDATTIRKTSFRHLLRTDAATRFEKGVDPNNTVYALKRAALLIQELAGGQIASNIVDVYPKVVERKQIKVRYQQINRLIGVNIDPATVKTILTAMEIDIVSENDTQLVVAVPTNKADVLREADIIEEIIRIYGFDKIPVGQSLQSAISYTQQPDPETVRNKTADFLAANGFNEIMTASISNSAYYQEDEQANIVHLLNSLNADMDVLRANMLFSGLEVITHNQNRQNTDLQLFEFGKTYNTYLKENIKQYEETERLSLLVSGSKTSENWQQKSEAVNYYDIKAIVDRLFNRLGITGIRPTVLSNDTFLSYGLTYKVRRKVELVTFGAVKPSVLKQLGVKQAVFYANINWSNVYMILQQSSKVSYQEVSKFPSVRRDLALVVDKAISFEQIREIAAKTGKQMLQSVNLFDVFEDEVKLGKGKKSYAVSFVLQDANKTLTDKEIERFMNKLIKNYEKQLSAALR